MDRANSMICAVPPAFIKSTPGADFLNIKLSKTFKELALSIFAIRRRQTFKLQICAKKFGEQRIALL